jgi:hypothetical protein
MNYCLVKYIHLKNVNLDTLHTAEDYELHKTVIKHSSYEELEQCVDRHCPKGFACERPIALHHEVLWRMMLRNNGKNMVETDELFNPIDCCDYCSVHWGISGDSLPSVCVHVDPIVHVVE